jgi:hypothetical protein
LPRKKSKASPKDLRNNDDLYLGSYRRIRGSGSTAPDMDVGHRTKNSVGSSGYPNDYKSIQVQKNESNAAFLHKWLLLADIKKTA